MFKKSIQTLKKMSSPFSDYHFADQLRLEDEPSLRFFSELVGGLIHKQNNHLTIVQGYSNLLASTLVDLKKRDNAVSIAVASEKLTKLNQRVTDCVPAGPLSTESLNALALIEEVISELPKNRAMAQIDIDCLCPDSSTELKGNQEALKSVLAELLDNSIHALGLTTHFKTISVSVYSPTEEYIGIEVKDMGGGIAAKDISSVFLPFYSIWQKEHPGIGLTRAAILTHRMEGRIGVKSETGSATVLLLLPVPSSL